MGGAQRGAAGQVAEDERVAAVRRLGVLDTEPEERFDRVARLAQQLFHVPSVMVSLVDADRLFYKAHIGTDVQQIPRRHSFCSMAIAEPATFVVEDASADPRYSANPYVAGDPRLRFYAGQPLVAPGGHRVGTLCVADDRPRAFSAADRALLGDLARWVEKELIVEAELERAASVQAGLLPAAPPVLDGYELAGACLPARAVGGDFYDWDVVTGGVSLTIADVMGKGMGAAILAATVRAVLRASGRGRGVDGALADTQAAVEPDLLASGSFVTAFHARLDTAAHELSYVDAGHGLSVVLTADGRVRRLASTGPPLGIPEYVGERLVTRLRLAPGDLLVTFSDGVLDVLDGTLAAVDRVAAAVHGAASAQDAVDRVLALAPAGADRPDDLTVLVLRRSDAPSDAPLDAPRPGQAGA
ncbi:PP2C family protein-serine/threonine phosphatase [Cellulomonas sp. NPDC055163]